MWVSMCVFNAYVWGETDRGFISVALQEEAAVALCSFLSVPLTCREGTKHSDEGRTQPADTKHRYDSLSRVYIYCSTQFCNVKESSLTVRVGLWKSLSCNQVHDGCSAGRQLQSFRQTIHI